MNDQVKKDNRGYLYPNKNKNKPTQPDFTGKVLVEGKEFRISAWENQTPEGNKYLSLAFSIPTPFINKENQSGLENNQQGQHILAPISDDLDLDSLLNSVDDDNPFN
jgi:uncharacterized protein (DUF736 family)